MSVLVQFSTVKIYFFNGIREMCRKKDCKYYLRKKILFEKMTNGYSR